MPGGAGAATSACGTRPGSVPAAISSAATRPAGCVLAATGWRAPALSAAAPAAGSGRSTAGSAAIVANAEPAATVAAASAAAARPACPASPAAPVVDTPPGRWARALTACAGRGCRVAAARRAGCLPGGMSLAAVPAAAAGCRWAGRAAAGCVWPPAGRPARSQPPRLPSSCSRWSPPQPEYGRRSPPRQLVQPRPGWASCACTQPPAALPARPLAPGSTPGRDWSAASTTTPTLVPSWTATARRTAGHQPPCDAPSAAWRSCSPASRR